MIQGAVMTCDRLLTVSEGGLEFAQDWMKGFADMYMHWNLEVFSPCQSYTVSNEDRFRQTHVWNCNEKSFFKDWSGYAEEMKTAEGEPWQSDTVVILVLALSYPKIPKRSYTCTPAYTHTRIVYVRSYAVMILRWECTRRVQQSGICQQVTCFASG